MSKKGEYETGKSKALRVAIIGCFAVFTVFAMIASLLFGSADISFEVILHTLMGNVQTTDEMVIWNIRFPRNIVGALVGANLAVSGAILQAVMKNPLADPGIVGVSSGAGLAGVIMLIFMPEASLLLTPVAFIGAMLSAAAVYALAWKNGIRSSCRESPLHNDSRSSASCCRCGQHRGAYRFCRSCCAAYCPPDRRDGLQVCRTRFSYPGGGGTRLL